MSTLVCVYVRVCACVRVYLPSPRLFIPFDALACKLGLGLPLFVFVPILFASLRTSATLILEPFLAPSVVCFLIFFKAFPLLIHVVKGRSYVSRRTVRFSKYPTFRESHGAGCLVSLRPDQCEGGAQPKNEPGSLYSLQPLNHNSSSNLTQDFWLKC